MARRPKRKVPASRTHTLVVLDRSGSMAPRTAATIDGFNEFISGLRRDAEGDVLVTLVQFDHDVMTSYAETPLADVRDLDTDTYVIGGSTALYDAVGEGIKVIENRIRKDDKVNVTIMTDGQENASSEHTRESINALMDIKRDAGWEFNFLGAGQAAWRGAGALGISLDNAIMYDGSADDTKQIFAAVAASNVATTRGLESSYRSSAPMIKASLEKKAQAKEDDADDLRAAARVFGRKRTR
jgi:uncharacterized protein YegL